MHQSSASSLSSMNLKKNRKTERRLAQGNRKAFPFHFSNHARHDKNETDLGPTKELARPVKSSATRSSLLKVLLLLPVFFLRSTS